MSKKLNSLEKHFRHSQADIKAAYANKVSHVQIMLPNDTEDDDLEMGSDEIISLSTVDPVHGHAHQGIADHEPQPSNLSKIICNDTA